MIKLKNLDLLVILTIVALNIVNVLLSLHISVISIAIALPLVFLLPSYVVTEVLLFKRPLNTTYCAILSIELSLAIDILGGFLLNIFVIGLRRISWIVLIGLLIVVFSLILAFLRREASSSGSHKPILQFRVYDYVFIGVAVLVIVLSLQYSARGVEQQPHQGFTQLWLLPQQSRKSCTIWLGVHSFEVTSMTYLIKLKENGKQAEMQSPITLAPQEEWDQAIALSIDTVGDIPVEVSLYKADRPRDVYREVHMVVHSVRGTKGKNVVCGTSSTPLLGNVVV